MNNISMNAYAKINLGLDVIGKRENGYHDLKMIMQTINLYDRLYFDVQESKGVELTSNLSNLPLGENNLIVRAANLMLEHYNISKGLRINLQKNIPIAAGMAGGSTDAATTMLAINKLFDLNIPQKELMELGIILGADVPYCILRGTALSEGIGEILTPLSPLPKCHILIVKPNASVSTKYVYQHLVLDNTTIHPDIDGIRACIEAKNIPGMCDLLGNVLETVTIPKHPKIEEIKQFMKSMGAIGTLMSGSGPTVFGIFPTYRHAKLAYDKFKKGPYQKQTFLTVPYDPNQILNNEK